MPDKWYKNEKRCIRCWRNKLKHGNKLKKVNGGKGIHAVANILDKSNINDDERIRQIKKVDYCDGEDKEYKIENDKLYVTDRARWGRPRDYFILSRKEYCSIKR